MISPCGRLGSQSPAAFAVSETMGFLRRNSLNAL
jgi:hypothetical protein